MITQCSRNQLYSTGAASVKPASKFLDIGSAIRPCDFLKMKTHICCEPYMEYVEILQKKFPDLIVLNMNWAEVVKYFPPKSVDTVFLGDVIEHLEKDEGLDLLLKTLPLVKQQVVITTPLGFFEQSHPDGIDVWGLHGGEWQRHRSGWVPEDFPTVEGGSWHFYVCNEFHYTNNLGQQLPAPRGAFWAVWTVD